jgi:hypothetical protein
MNFTNMSFAELHELKQKLDNEIVSRQKEQGNRTYLS